MYNIILSTMPNKMMTLVEFFGYKEDGKVELELLTKAGGRIEADIWTGESSRELFLNQI